MSVPKVEKDDWNCKGQLITITMPLKSTFGEVKAKIEADTGMPPGKQKLQCESIFVKGTYRGYKRSHTIRRALIKLFYFRFKQFGILQYQAIITGINDIERAWWTKKIILFYFRSGKNIRSITSGTSRKILIIAVSVPS